MKVYFIFKQFQIHQKNVPFKFGTDSVLLGSWAQGDDLRKVLDVGTGSGILALMIAQRYPKAIISGIDHHSLGIETARDNFQSSLFKDRLNAIHEDYNHFETLDRFDLILSNPPFFRNSLLGDKKGRNEARHELSLTLNNLFSKSRQLISSEGSFQMIWPFSDLQRAIEVAGKHGFHLGRMCKVRSYEDRPFIRVLLDFRTVESDCTETEMILYAEKGIRSNTFSHLTKAFYLDS